MCTDYQFMIYIIHVTEGFRKNELFSLRSNFMLNSFKILLKNSHGKINVEAR